MSQSPFSAAAGNPYQSPLATDALPEVPSQGAASVTARTIELLAATRPWVRFLSILGYIIAGLTVIGGLFAAVFGMSQGQFEMIGIALFYAVFGVLYWCGALYLGRYAGHISDLQRSGSVHSLEEALAAQKTFWRFVGILMAVVLSIYAVLIVIGIVIAIGAAVLSRA